MIGGKSLLQVDGNFALGGCGEWYQTFLFQNLSVWKAKPEFLRIY
jgi:hypothetical protein